MNRNTAIAIAALMLLSAAAGAAAMHLLDAATAGDERAAPVASTAAAAQPAAPPPQEQTYDPAATAPPSPAELEADYHQALADQNRGIENFFLDQGQISGARVALLRADEEYAQFVEYLQTYTTAAGEQHVATLQQGLSRQPLVLDGTVALSDLACGSVLCTVSLTGRDQAAIDDYLDTALRAPGEPVYVAMRLAVATRGGAGIRLIFSVDPSVKTAFPG